MPDPVVSSADPELRAHVERVLSANYELDREIGRGGMGIVYLARDRRLKRQVAVKVLPPELAFRSEIRTRFLREAETAAQLSHPNIVPIYSVDERDGIVYFVMAYIDGENLAVRLHTKGALDHDETRRIMLEVSHALAYAHERGVVHRDIKPDNILLQREDGRCMVTDFGIARAVTDGADARLTATGMAIGTPAYMSPEQSTGEREIDGRSDLYSLGVVGYQMLTGDPPFEAPSTPALLVKHLSELPEPVELRRADAPPDLARAVMLLLEKDPANRFPSAGALAAALESRDVPALRTAPRHTQPPRSSLRAEQAAAMMATHDDYVPLSDERARWDHPKVREFRRRVGPYFIVNSVIVLVSIFTGTSFLFVTAGWSVWMAFKYAKLWTDGYDWHDVFKQPHDRMFFDVVSEWIDNIRALWDKNKQAEVRARARARMSSGVGVLGREEARGALPRPGGLDGRDLTTLAGPHASKVRKAAQQRDEIIGMVERMPKGDRGVLSDVPSTANALYDRVQGLAVSLAELERNVAPDAADVVEREISSLEAQANPLDVRASEERVRRLAYLKRQRQQVGDLVRRRREAEDRLERCILALQNMRLDVVKLRTGGQTLQQVTQVAEKAMELAREVDNAVYVASEMNKLKGRNREAGGGSRQG